LIAIRIISVVIAVVVDIARPCTVQVIIASLTIDVIVVVVVVVVVVVAVAVTFSIIIAAVTTVIIVNITVFIIIIAIAIRIITLLLQMSIRCRRPTVWNLHNSYRYIAIFCLLVVSLCDDLYTSTLPVSNETTNSERERGDSQHTLLCVE
jgi:hypothetical protein